MYLRIFVIILIGLVLNLQNVSAEENDYGIVKAWFAEINATDQTAEGVKLKVGEPSELKVEVISKIDGNVYIKLYEPGFTNAFKVISGSSAIGTTVPNSGVSTGWAKTYSWIVAPNGDWKNGNAPLNIFVQFSKIENGKKKGEKTIDFTIVNPYILNEEFNGAISTAKSTHSPTENASPTPVKAVPFTPFLFAVGALLLAWRWR